MSSEDQTAATGGAQPSQKDAFFFLTILSNMKNKPDVDWEAVAAKAGYNNANTAKVRYGQIKRKLGYTEDGTAPTGGTPKVKTPNKTGAKKETGSGSNTTPSKVTKKASGAKKMKSPTKTPKDEMNAEAIEDIKAEYDLTDEHFEVQEPEV